MKRKYFIAALCFLLAGALIAAGCGPSAGTSGSAAGAAEKVLTIGILGEPPSFDPKDFNSSYATITAYNCYDTLLKFSDDGTEVLPNIAKSWEQKDDLTYVYQIRDDIKFSDGSQMTTDDIVFSLNRIMDPATAASMSYLFGHVKSFEKTGEWELTVSLKSPDSTWKYVPATSPCKIVKKAAVEADANYGKVNGGPVVGTGPYILDKWTSGSEITLKKNQYWWGDKSAQMWDSIDYKVISDATSLALAAKNGQLDYVHAFTADTLDVYQSAPNLKVFNYKGTTSSFIGFNTQKAPFDDSNVRKACAYAIDKASIAKSIGGVFANVSGGVPMPDSMFYLDPETWKKADSETIEDYSYDLAKAKDCLAASKYPDGFSCTIYCTSTTKKLAEAVQYALQQINIQVTVNAISSSEMYDVGYGYKVDENGKRVYDLICTGWLSDYLDPIGYLKPFWSSDSNYAGGANRAAYSNPDVDKLISQTYVEKDDKVRSDLMIQAFTLAAEDCPYDTLYDYDAVYALSTKYAYSEGPCWFWNFQVTNIKKAN